MDDLSSARGQCESSNYIYIYNVRDSTGHLYTQQLLSSLLPQDRQFATCAFKFGEIINPIHAFLSLRSIAQHGVLS